MFINKTIVYAISCLYYLDKHCKDGWCSVEDISKNRKIPYAYCNKILQKLVERKIVVSKKGYGFRLRKDLDEVDFDNFLKVFNGKALKMDKENLKTYNVVKDILTKAYKGFKLRSIFFEIRKKDIK